MEGGGLAVNQILHNVRAKQLHHIAHPSTNRGRIPRYLDSGLLFRGLAVGAGGWERRNRAVRVVQVFLWGANQADLNNSTEAQEEWNAGDVTLEWKSGLKRLESVLGFEKTYHVDSKLAHKGLR